MTDPIARLRVTTNPTIFAKAITGSDAYDGQVRDLKLRQIATDQARSRSTRGSPATRTSDAFVIAGGGLAGSGTPGELMEAGISASRIAAAARELVKD